MKTLWTGSAYILTTGFWIFCGGNLALAQQARLADLCIGLHVALADLPGPGKSSTAPSATGAGTADLRGSVPGADGAGLDGDAQTSAVGEVAPGSSAGVGRLQDKTAASPMALATSAAGGSVDTVAARADIADEDDIQATALYLGQMAGVITPSPPSSGSSVTFWRAQIDAFETQWGMRLKGLISAFGDPSDSLRPTNTFAGPAYQLRGIVKKDESMALTSAVTSGDGPASNGDTIRAAYNNSPALDNGMSMPRTDKSARSPTSARSRA